MPIEEPELPASEPDTPGKTTVGLQQPKPESAWTKGTGHSLHQQQTKPHSWVDRPRGWVSGGGRGDRWNNRF
jgi:hypothetical protein